MRELKTNALVILIIIAAFIIAAALMISRKQKINGGGNLAAEKLIDTYKRGRPIKSNNIGELIEFLRECPFPYLGSEIDLAASVKFMRAMNTEPINDKWELSRGKLAPAYKSRMIWFDLPKASHEILNPTDAFTEDRRMAVSVAGLPSPIEFWKSENGRKVIAKWLARQKIITKRILHDALYQADWMKVRPATEFHTAHVINLLKFAARELRIETSQLRFYDPCAGHGSRLFGACVVGARYLACDPDKDLIQPHADIAKYFGAESLVRIMPIPAETIDAQVLSEFAPNLVFTSPPFFNYEQYSLANTAGQSTQNYTSYELWKEKFLRVVLIDAARALTPGGLMFIHLSDIAGYPLAADMIRMDIPANYIGAIGLRGEGGKMRPVWCWQV